MILNPIRHHATRCADLHVSPQDWWAFAKKNDVQIVDDYDEIHSTITPFFPLPPDILAERLHKVLYDEEFSFRMFIRQSQPILVEGDRASAARPRLLSELSEGFRSFLPRDFGEGAGTLGEGGARANEGVVAIAGWELELGAWMVCR